MLAAVSYVRGILVLVTAVVMLGAFFWWIVRRSREPADLVMRLVIMAGILAFGYYYINKLAGDGSAAGQIAGVLIGLVIGLALAFVWVPAFVNKVSDWIGSLYTGGLEPPTPVPFYSSAVAKRKQGKFREAIYDIQEQLERFPDDVTGHVMLAEIQAEDLHDLSAAQISINRFCDGPQRTPAHIAYALNALADWHLKMARDTDAAREALERVRALLPDTDQAMMAAQRVAHLASPETLLAEQEHKPIHLHRGAMNVGLMANSSTLRQVAEDPAETAARLVRQLEAHPLDCEAREKLAVIYAEHFGRLDLATEQLEQLITAPHQPPKEIARWLNLLADFQINDGSDYDTARQTLQRIVDQFPGVAAERLAQQRIEYLRLELKGKEKSQPVQMGSYEKDLGLRKPRPS
jgi:tetratricopeptide (TPR) repeat protein